MLSLVTLTLKFDLHVLLKNFNLGHSVQTTRDGDFIFHVCSLWLGLSHGIISLTLKSDLLLKIFNLGYNFQTTRNMTFIIRLLKKREQSKQLVKPKKKPHLHFMGYNILCAYINKWARSRKTCIYANIIIMNVNSQERTQDNRGNKCVTSMRIFSCKQS